MTVKELITELQKHPADLEVITEGCDCNGHVQSVWLETEVTEEPYVYLRRD
jgi:hypothetical protein